MNDQPPSDLSVLLIADPGLPTRRATASYDTIRHHLEEIYDRPVTLTIETELIPIDQANHLKVSTVDDIRSRYEHVDAVIVFTEMPRQVAGHPLVAGVFPDHSFAVISCPTLGAWASTKRIGRIVAGCAVRLRNPQEQAYSQGSGRSQSAASSARDDAEPSVATHESRSASQRFDVRWATWHRRDDGNLALSTSRLLGGWRLILGMVVANEPWRTAPKLSGAMAAASATGAFGIFYSSIWQMSDALSALRLTLTGVLAVAMMVAWLIASNKLWDSPRKESLTSVVLLYNLSTVATLTLAVAALYAALFSLILVAGLVVIAPDFMTQVLGYSSDFQNYLKIAWLSSAMGVVAGALGSSFDSDSDLRQLTHGQRERQRVIEEESDQPAT